jgi:hypothetical protein
MMGGFDLKEPTSEKAEKEILTTIISELRKGMALKLDKAPTIDRTVPVKGGGEKERFDFLVKDRNCCNGGSSSGEGGK